MNLSMEQKRTHRHREQICGCQGGEGWGRGGGGGWGGDGGGGWGGMVGEVGGEMEEIGRAHV